MFGFEYSCRYCDEMLHGSFSDNVYCPECDITYETYWDWKSDTGEITSYLTHEHKGEVDV